MNRLLVHTDFELNHFFEYTPDLVCIANKEGFFEKVNSSVLQKLEYEADEIYTHPISFFMHPEDVKRTQHTRQEMLDGAPLINFQNRYVSKSEKIIWLEWTSIYFSDKEIIFAINYELQQAQMGFFGNFMVNSIQANTLSFAQAAAGRQQWRRIYGCLCVTPKRF